MNYLLYLMKLAKIINLKNGCIHSLYFFLFIPLIIFSQDNSLIVTGKKEKIYSKILSEEREYWISLPSSYNDKKVFAKSYPVLVLFDPEDNFKLFSEMVSFMASNMQIPEMIVLGIKNIDRNKDLTPTYSIYGYDNKIDESLRKSGGGGDFLRFIERELFVELSKNYRINDYKIMVGHSFGGLLSIYAIIKDLEYNSVLAIDPSLWWDNQVVTEILDSDFKQGIKIDKRIYISISHDTREIIDSSLMRKSQIKFAKIFELKFNNVSNFRLDKYEKEDHGTIPLISFYKGMLFLFEDYHIPLIYELDADDINKHFNALSLKFNYPFKPDEGKIMDFADYYFYVKNQKEKGISYYEMNVNNYDMSYNAHFKLGLAYKDIGEYNKALKHFNKSLDLQPNNSNAKRELKNILKVIKN